MLFGNSQSSSWRRAVDGHLVSCSRCRRLVSALVKLESTPGKVMPSVSPTPSSTEADDRGSASLSPGVQVGRYEILESLGEGGMGIVYGAQDLELGRKVALKLLRGGPHHVARARLHERFRKEAQAMAQVTHPNVVTVYDVGTWGDRIFIAMEMIEGQTLSRWLATSRRSWREVVVVFIAAGQGLAAAHAAGLVHRDFKPSNVLIGTDGRVRVGDFGLATMGSLPGSDGEHADVDHGTSVESVSTLLAGTPIFMAPEQLRGGAPDARSDQFSFGVALHMAITGEHPFAGDSVEEILKAVLEGRLQRTARKAMPRWLWKVVERSISIDPDDRYPAMAALLVALASGASRRRTTVFAGEAIACATILVGVLALGIRTSQPPGSTRAIEQAPAPPRYDAELLAGTPDLLEAYDREWNALHSDPCRAPSVRCGIQATNLLRNADFARAGQAWYSDTSTDLTWVDGYLCAVAVAPGGAVRQDVPWIVSPGRAYRFTVWIRASRGDPSARGSLTLASTGPKGDSRSATPFRAGPDWNPVSVAISADTPGDHFRTELVLDPSSRIDIDNAELIDAGLVDPGFEVLPAGAWRPVYHAKDIQVISVATDARDGGHVLRVRTAAREGSVAQDTSRAPLAGTTYTFSAWVRAGSADSLVDGRLALWALGGNEAVTLTAFRVGGSWTNVAASLYVEGHRHTSLRAELYLDTVNAPLDIDAATLIPAGLVDASFETGTPGWYPLGSAVISRHAAGDQAASRTRVAKDGSAWLRLAGPQADVAVAQDLGSPVRGTTYRFSAWLRAAPESAGAVSGSITVRGLGGAGEQARTAFTLSQEWTLVSVAHTFHDDRYTGLRVAVALDAAGMQLDIDGTQLTGAVVIPIARPFAP